MPKRKRVQPEEGLQAPQSKPDRPPTDFEERLYQLCKCIPAGKVTTYGAMAAVFQSAPRAVGQALRRNPFAPVVPCHRVVASSLDIGGFSGAWGISEPKVQRKLRLLQDEGVEFKGSVVRSAAFVMGPDELRQAQADAQGNRSKSRP